MVLPLVTESVLLPPLVPMRTGGVCLALLFSTTALALPLMLELDCEVAVTVTVFPESKFAGAVYRPVEAIVPVELLPPCTPLTLQFNAGKVPVFAVAMNWAVPPNATTAGLLQLPLLSWAQTLKALLGAGVGVGVLLAWLELPPQPATVKSRARAQMTFHIPVSDSGSREKVAQPC